MYIKQSAIVNYNCNECGNFQVIHETNKPNPNCWGCGGIPNVVSVEKVMRFIDGSWITLELPQDRLYEIWKSFDE